MVMVLSPPIRQQSLSALFVREAKLAQLIQKIKGRIMVELYKDLAAAGSLVIQHDNGQVEIEDMLITCNTAGASVTLSDGITTKTLYLNIGPNDFCEWVIIFQALKNITITAVGGNVSIFLKYNIKRGN
jgi:hypothetical protein